MTREEQIIEKAGKDAEVFYKVNGNYGDCFHGGFIDGAKWADENPQFSKEEFIEKACKWLEELADGFIIRSKIIGYDCDKKHLVEDFKQRMGKEL